MSKLIEKEPVQHMSCLVRARVLKSTRNMYFYNILCVVVLLCRCVVVLLSLLLSCCLRGYCCPCLVQVVWSLMSNGREPLAALWAKVSWLLDQNQQQRLCRETRIWNHWSGVKSGRDPQERAFVRFSAFLHVLCAFVCLESSSVRKGLRFSWFLMHKLTDPITARRRLKASAIVLFQQYMVWLTFEICKMMQAARCLCSSLSALWQSWKQVLYANVTEKQSSITQNLFRSPDWKFIHPDFATMIALQCWLLLGQDPNCLPGYRRVETVTVCLGQVSRYVIRGDCSKAKTYPKHLMGRGIKL